MILKRPSGERLTVGQELLEEGVIAVDAAKFAAELNLLQEALGLLHRRDGVHQPKDENIVILHLGRDARKAVTAAAS